MEIENIEKILKTRPQKGGGGTTFGCVVDYMKKKSLRPKVMIVFTDGFIEDNPPKPNCEHLLWVLTHRGIDEHIKQLGGMIIRMDKDDLNRNDGE